MVKDGIWPWHQIFLEAEFGTWMLQKSKHSHHYIDPKSVFVSFRLLPLMAEFSVFIPPQGIASRNSWLRDFFLKYYKIIRKIKMREMKTKLHLKILIVLWINSSCKMNLRIYGQGRTQISLSSPSTIGPLASIQDKHGLYWYNNC